MIVQSEENFVAPPDKVNPGGEDPFTPPGFGIALYQIVGFIRRHGIFIGALAIVGATIGFLLSQSSQRYYESTYSLDADPNNPSVMHDPTRMTAELGSLFSQITFSRTFAAKFLEHLETMDAIGKKAASLFVDEIADSFSDRSQELIADTEKASAEERPRLLLLAYLVGPVTDGLRNSAIGPRTSRYSFLYLISPGTMGFWKVTLRSQHKGAGPAIVQATAVALTETVNLYNSMYLRKLEELRAHQMEKAKSSFLQSQSNWATQMSLSKSKRIQMKLDFYTFLSELRSVAGRVARKNPVAPLVNSARGIGDVSIEDRLIIGGNELNVNDNIFIELEINRAAKNLAEIERKELLNEDEFNSFRSRLEAIQTLFSEQRSRENAIERSMSSAQSAFTSAVAGAFTPFDTSAFFLPTASFREEYAQARNVYIPFEKTVRISPFLSTIAGFFLALVLSVLVGLFKDSLRRRRSFKFGIFSQGNEKIPNSAHIS